MPPLAGARVVLLHLGDSPDNGGDRPQVRIRLDPLEDFPPVELRHDDVANNQVWGPSLAPFTLLIEELEHLLPVGHDLQSDGARVFPLPQCTGDQEASIPCDLTTM